MIYGMEKMISLQVNLRVRHVYKRHLDFRVTEQVSAFFSGINEEIRANRRFVRLHRDQRQLLLIKKARNIFFSILVHTSLPLYSPR